ncbi:MAG: hypothetical protein K2X93_07785 [Candidatus Obscuribacterales bacterium]|nr:hypothetical protein [Candidatus Obscuribacterales bacterium]
MTVEHSREFEQKFTPSSGVQKFDVLALMMEGFNLTRVENTREPDQCDANPTDATVDRPHSKQLDQSATIAASMKDTPQQKVELPDKMELERRAIEKQEKELLDSIATLISVNGDNKYALKVLFGDLPAETTAAWPVSRINDKLEALGSNKRVSFRGNQDGTKSMIVYHTEKTTAKSEKYTALYEITVTPKKSK